jgi:hypothetical protein
MNKHLYFSLAQMKAINTKVGGNFFENSTPRTVERAHLNYIIVMRKTDGIVLSIWKFNPNKSDPMYGRLTPVRNVMCQSFEAEMWINQQEPNPAKMPYASLQV